MEKKKNKLLVASKSDSKDFELGSENVFADLGFANPEEELAKANLAIQICHIIKQKKLTQVNAATLLGVDQAKVSALMNGKLSAFSIDRLFRFLNDLGQDVNIKIKPKASTRKRGSTIVGVYNSICREIGRTPTQKPQPQFAVHAKKRP